jgi:hypothetical protein
VLYESRLVNTDELQISLSPSIQKLLIHLGVYWVSLKALTLVSLDTSALLALMQIQLFKQILKRLLVFKDLAASLQTCKILPVLDSKPKLALLLSEQHLILKRKTWLLGKP